MKILKANNNNNISSFISNKELIRYDLRNQNINIDSSKVTLDSNNHIEVGNITRHNNIPVFDITGQGVTYNKHNNRVTIDPSISTNIKCQHKIFSGTVHANKTDVQSVSLSSNQSTLEVGNYPFRRKYNFNCNYITS